MIEFRRVSNKFEADLSSIGEVMMSETWNFNSAGFASSRGSLDVFRCCSSLDNWISANLGDAEVDRIPQSLRQISAQTEQ